MRTCMLMACLLALPRVGWCQEDTLQGLWKPVDLQLDRVETRQAFERLFAASGVRVQIPPENSDKRITVGLKKATFWQGLDEICRADGGVSYPERIYQSSDHHLVHRRWIECPTWYGGPLRLTVCDSARVREIQYPDRVDRTELALVMQWLPTFVPGQEARLGVQGELSITRAEDSTGKSLLPLIVASKDFDRWPSASMEAPLAAWLLRLQPTASGAKSVRLLEGTWSVKCLNDVQEVRFDKPEASVGTARQVGPMTVTLKSLEPVKGRFGESETRYCYTIRLSYDQEKAPADWKESLKTLGLKARVLPFAQTEGVEPSSDYIDVSKSGSNWVEFSTPWGSRSRPTAITLRVGASVLPVRVPFTLKDISLPEDVR